MMRVWLARIQCLFRGHQEADAFISPDGVGVWRCPWCKRETRAPIHVEAAELNHCIAEAHSEMYEELQKFLEPYTGDGQRYAEIRETVSAILATIPRRVIHERGGPKRGVPREIYDLENLLMVFKAQKAVLKILGELPGIQK